MPLQMNNNNNFCVWTFLVCAHGGRRQVFGSAAYYATKLPASMTKLCEYQA